MSIKIQSAFSIFMFLLMSGALISQNNSNNNQQDINSSNIYLHVEGGVKKEKPKTVEEQISNYNLNEVNNMINAFEVKKQYVANDQNQDSIAKENGWYDRINYELGLLYKRKEILESNIEK